MVAYLKSEKLDYKNYSINVVLEKPAIIIPHSFVQIGAFVALLVQSVTTVKNYIKRDGLKVYNKFSIYVNYSLRAHQMNREITTF